MCGIVAAIAERNVVPILIDGLHRLEYRGYDSAGIAVLDQGKVQRVRREGKVRTLEQASTHQNLHGSIGIAHTRWATHGKPCERNAHPHAAGDIFVVHNGIIENHKDIQEKLGLTAAELGSETDSELIACLIQQKCSQGLALRQAVQQAVAELAGAFAIAVMHAHNPDLLVVARMGSPLVIGLGIGEHFVASDPLALHKVTQEFVFLEEGDVAEITLKHIKVFDLSGQVAIREARTTQLQVDAVEKGEFRHFMQKEMHEQSRACGATLAGRVASDHVLEQSFGRKASVVFDQTQAIQIVACGTSYHAGLVAKYWVESLVGIPCYVDIASEFRYKTKIVSENTLFVTISQSGETADTLAALKDIQKTGDYFSTLSICNVPESSLVRSSDLVLLTHAGPEIGVASTKGFTTQLTALLLLTAAFAKRNSGAEDSSQHIIEQLNAVPEWLSQCLAVESVVEAIAELFDDKRSALYLGRGIQFPIALEGALKLKELSYIHAEAYPAGELKHGPLALVEHGMPVIALAPNDALLEKIKSNIEEVRARGGEVIVVTCGETHFEPQPGLHVLQIPEAPALIQPLAFTIPLQLLSYHVAVNKGTDVDQPRNLAKSVTVE